MDGEVKRELHEKVGVVSEFTITDKSLKKEVAKRKNWTAPGIIDRCITEEVKQYHRNLAVAFYDYKKAYDKVHHDWMTRVYEWIGIPRNVIQLIDKLMCKWKTRLEIWNGGEKMTSR